MPILRGSEGEVLFIIVETTAKNLVLFVFGFTVGSGSLSGIEP